MDEFSKAMGIAEFPLLSGGHKVGVYTRKGIMYEVGIHSLRADEFPDHGRWRGMGGQEFEWYKLAKEKS